MGKKNEKKTRKWRSQDERISDMKRKIAELEAKKDIEGLKRAVKDGRVSEDDKKDYRKLNRALGVMEKAPGVFADFGMEDESDAAAKLRSKIISKMKKMLNGSEDDYDEDEDEDEGDEFEESASGADDDDDDDDDDEFEDDDDDDDDD